MNKIKSLIGVALLFSIYMSVHGAVGCMDNSHHCTQRYDSKAYHFVACNCPCTQISASRGKCMECNHYRIPKNFETISRTPRRENTAKQSELLKTPLLALQEMVNRYQLNK